MKKKTLLWISMLFLLLPLQIASAQEWLGAYLHETGKPSGNINYYEVKAWALEHFREAREKMEEERKEGKMFVGEEEGEVGEYIKYKRWEWFWSTRINQDGTLGYLTEKVRTGTNSSRLRLASGTPAWTSIGFTSNSGGYWGMGKADCIGFHPTNANIFYVGSDGGGLWKTTNGGLSYTAIGDYLPISQVARIIVDAVNPNIIYIALAPKGGAHSMGIYKSTDAGLTFAPTAMTDEYNSGATIQDMIVSPSNSSILLVGKSNGIYRTTDGGGSWTRVTTWSCRQLVWKPGSTTRVYAVKDDYWGGSDIFYSDDAGASWDPLTSIGKSQVSLLMAVTPVNPNIIAYSMVDYSFNPKVKSFYVSKNNGAAGSFTFKSYLPEEDHVFISGIDEKFMYNGGVNISTSTDSGATWTRQTDYYNNPPYKEIHADVRNIYYSRTDPGIIYFCNDGGVVRYDERNNTWQELNNGLQITQYYSIACAQTDAVIVTAGSQDNGGSRRRADGTWMNTNGGDAMMQAIDATNADIMYTTYINGELFRSLDGYFNPNAVVKISNNIPGGKPNADWVMPYVLDPNDSRVIVAGYDDVYRSPDKGDTWSKISNGMTNTGTIKAIAVAPSDSRVIYCSGDQKQPDNSWRNKLYRTTDQGASWNEFTLPTGETITQIAVHSSNPLALWVTTGGWTRGEKVFASTDGGQTWTNISQGLPNVPTNAIIYHQGNANDALYVGNDIGVYYRDKTMTTWESYSAGLPNTKVTDLDIQYSAGLLRAATYGRGAWEAPLVTSVSQVEDCAGITGGSAQIDGCGVCAGGTTGIVPNSSCCNPGATIAVEKWTNVQGNYITDIPVDTPPQEVVYITDLDKNFHGEDNIGARIKGLLCPPETGTYTFWIASDDQSELWLGTTDQESSKSRIAYVDWAVGVRDFDATSVQKSAAISLQKGQNYYIEILYKEGGGDAHVAVAWAYGTQTRTIIKGGHIIQGAMNTPPTVSITTPANGASYTDPANITISATASDLEGPIAKVEFYQGNVKLGEDLNYPSWAWYWQNVPAGTYTLTAKAYDQNGLSTTSAPVTVTVTGSTPACILDEPSPDVTKYVVRNSWNDQFNGSSVISESGAMKVVHRAWGQSELWVIETGKNISVTSGKTYNVTFDFKDYAGAPVSGVDIGFAQGLNSSQSGPQLAQPVVAAPSGYSSSNYTTKTVAITSAVTASNINLAFRLRWPGQPSVQVSDYIKNITVCEASSGAKMSSAADQPLVVLPNPSKDVFTLKTTKAIDLLNVTDSQGRQVFTATDIAEETSFDFGNDLDFGIYNISVKYSDGSSASHKILKTR